MTFCHLERRPCAVKLCVIHKKNAKKRGVRALLCLQNKHNNQHLELAARFILVFSHATMKVILIKTWDRTPIPISAWFVGSAKKKHTHTHTHTSLFWFRHRADFLVEFTSFNIFRVTTTWTSKMKTWESRSIQMLAWCVVLCFYETFVTTLTNLI